MRTVSCVTGERLVALALDRAEQVAVDTMVDKLEYGDVVVCAVQSNPDEIFEEPRQELINASVLSVEDKSTRDSTIVRARVIGPVAHTDDHGNFAGHRIHVGAQIDVPRRFVLTVARRKQPTKSGYGSRGEAAAELDPSNTTRKVYKVHPFDPKHDEFWKGFWITGAAIWTAFWLCFVAQMIWYMSMQPWSGGPRAF